MKIISGGQTGVDRAALDAAIILNLDHGGWCPKGRRCETGSIPDEYNLIETESEEYAVRTEMNIEDSDGTLVFVPCIPITVTDGTNLTIELAKKHSKPCLVVDLSQEIDFESILKWSIDNSICVLNVAGPRESQAEGVHDKCLELFMKLFEFIFTEKNQHSLLSRM